MIIDLLIERKRKQLDKAIDKYGLRDKRTLALSQQLDILIVEKQKKSS